MSLFEMLKDQWHFAAIIGAIAVLFFVVSQMNKNVKKKELQQKNNAAESPAGK